LAFDAAEAAIAGVIYESEDTELLADPDLLDPLTAARQNGVFDPDNHDMACSDAENWTNRHVTKDGLSDQAVHNTDGVFHDIPETRSWSRTAYVKEQSCRGSSSVIGGININCHVFIVRGCGNVKGKSVVVANTLAASVFAPSAQ
jgi:type IV pilus assembly protein PilX